MYSLYSLAHISAMAVKAAADYLGVDDAAIQSAGMNIEAAGTYFYITAKTNLAFERRIAGPNIVCTQDENVVALGGIDFFLENGELTIEVSFNWDIEDPLPDELLRRSSLSSGPER
jgi:hypothetical protein